MVPNIGVKPTTFALQERCTINCANRANLVRMYAGLLCYFANEVLIAVYILILESGTRFELA